MAFIKYEDILNATDGGLQILEMLFPGATEALSKRDKKFKLRNDEKTASASIRRKEDGWYYVTDFGGDSKERHAINWYMIEKQRDFKEACAELGALFKLQGAEDTWTVVKPIIEKRPLKKGELEGQVEIEYKEFTPEELALIGKLVTETHCSPFNFKSVRSITRVKMSEAVVTTATAEYPIFAFDFGDWQKIYQPMSFKKQYRFTYAGNKPQTHWFGLDYLQKVYEKNRARIDKETTALGEAEDLRTPEQKDPRVEAAFIVSGGSDGMNLFSLGGERYPVWGNSETDELSGQEYARLRKYAKEVYYIADLDATGRRQAIKLGLKFLDIRLVWLPAGLTKYRDRRGNPCKDFKDFVTKMCNVNNKRPFEKQLEAMVNNALPLKFWDEGWKSGKKTYNYRFTQALQFLRLLGFGMYQDENIKEGYFFIHIDGNFVKRIKAVDIKYFVHDFLEKRQMPTGLRDMIYTTPYLGENSLRSLPKLDVEFESATYDKQYWFFRRETWEITATGIQKHRLGDVQRYKWDDMVIDRPARLMDKRPFEITKEPTGDLDIKILDSTNKFQNYLINTSRVHWRAEMEDAFAKAPKKDQEAYFKANQFNIEGPKLSEDQIYEQKQHLINKIYSIGYLLHNYKNKSKAWCVFAMDGKIADNGEANGGSGKSLCYDYLKEVINRFYIKGRNPKVTQDDFIYGGVTEDTDYIFIDDAHQYLDFNFFFSEITSSLRVNPKNGQSFEIPFSKSPKFCITSNFTPSDVTSSSERRMLYTVFSDWYHFNHNEEYNEIRQVSDDFGGKNLFDDFDEKDWTDVFNFWGRCVEFFLSHPLKVVPPMANVKKRSLIREMGNDFMEWSATFFARTDHQGALYLDNYFVKYDAFKDFTDTTRNKMKITRFKKAMQAYCTYNGYILNPKDKNLDSNGRIMQKVGTETKEMFYIDTKLAKPYVEEEDNERTIFDDDGPEDLKWD